MFNNHGGVNQSSGDCSVGKKLDKHPTFGDFSEAYNITTRWVKKGGQNYGEQFVCANIVESSVPPLI